MPEPFSRVDSDGDRVSVAVSVDACDYDVVHVMTFTDGAATSAYLARLDVVELMDWLQAWLDEQEDSEDPAVTDWAEAVVNGEGESTLLADAHTTVYGDRDAEYGHPRQTLTRAAVLWTGLLQGKLSDGEFVSPEDVGRLMIGMKLARDMASHRRDNRVDIAGYALALDRLETGL